DPKKSMWVRQSEASGMEAPGATPRLPVTFILPDGRNVLSSDGQTYRDPATGETKEMPSDAVRVGSDGALTEIRTHRAIQDAKGRVGDGGEPSPGLGIPGAAREGTGPWANLMAAFDAVVGGAGIDKVIGQEGFFQ